MCVHDILAEFGNKMDNYHENLLEKAREKYFKGEDVSNYNMETDCIEHILGAGGIENYGDVLKFMKQNNFKHLVDIGCAYGHQSEIFRLAEVKYDGIEISSLPFYNGEEEDVKYHQFLFGEDEFKNISVSNKTLAVGILSLGWNCYLSNDIETLLNQAKELSKNFNHALLYMMDDYVDYFKKEFRGSEHIKDNFYYFFN